MNSLPLAPQPKIVFIYWIISLTIYCKWKNLIIIKQASHLHAVSDANDFYVLMNIVFKANNILDLPMQPSNVLRLKCLGVRLHITY